MKHNKKYPNEQEEQRRYRIFRENKEKVEKQNKRFLLGEESFTWAINQFGDMLASEVTARFTGLNGPYRLVIVKCSKIVQTMNVYTQYAISGSTLQITLLTLPIMTI